jgi:lysozyme family protein
MVMLKNQMYNTPTMMTDPRQQVTPRVQGSSGAPNFNSAIDAFSRLFPVQATGGLATPLPTQAQGTNPFSYAGSGYSYSDYDPVTNTVSHNMSGIAGNIDAGRVSVSDLTNPENVRNYNEDFANAFNQYQNQANVNTGGNTGFATPLPTQAPVAAPTAVGLTNVPSAPSSVGAGDVALGGALGGLLSGNFDLQNILGTAGQAYLGQEAISAPYEVGRAGLELAEQVGQRGLEAAEFKPYTVTSNLARVGTDPS